MCVTLRKYMNIFLFRQKNKYKYKSWSRSKKQYTYVLFDALASVFYTKCNTVATAMYVVATSGTKNASDRAGCGMTTIA